MSRFPFLALLRQRLYDLLRHERDEASPIPAQPGIDGEPARDKLDQRIDATAYRRAVVSLPPGRREIFELHQIDGLSFVEVAERTGTSVAHVELEIAAALTHLTTRLHGDVGRPA